MAETFGKTTKGGAETSYTAGYIMGCKFTSGSAGSLASLTKYVKFRTSDAHIKCAIYDSPYNLLTNGTTEEKLITSGQDNWLTFNFGASKPEVAASTVYRLAWWCDVSFYGYKDAGSSAQLFYKGNPYNGWPDHVVPDGTVNEEHSIYATYYEEAPPAVKTLVQAALISIPPLVVLPTLAQILRLTGGC